MDSKYDHYQGAYFPMPIQIICGIIGIIGLAVIFTSPLIGILMLFLGVFVISSRCGIEIDFDKQKYRDYWGPLKIKFGKWYAIPEIDYISVFRARTTQTISSRVSSTSLEAEEIQVNLITENRKRITIFETDDKNKAIGRAWKFSEKFNVGILDATSRESEWIKE